MNRSLIDNENGEYMLSQSYGLEDDAGKWLLKLRRQSLVKINYVERRMDDDSWSNTNDATEMNGGNVNSYWLVF